MLVGLNKTIEEQLKILEKILSKNEKLMSILKILNDYSSENLKFKNYYVTAGAINQTVFNYYHNFDLNYGIKDFDIIYFDSDVSYEAEDKIIKELTNKLKKIDAFFDIKNEARVHMWIYDKYGIKRDPYISVEDAISSFGATITCIGVRLKQNKLQIFCPYGLNDIFSMTIRPVKKKFTKKQYFERARRWKEKWPGLQIEEW